ncbi:MAG: putative quinol monooxygenase [Myxococcota bacterium]
MDGGHIKVVATVTAKLGHEEALKAILLSLLPITRAEEGCLFYELHQASDPQVFTFIEGWASDETLDEHLASEHLEEAMEAIVPLVVGAPDIRRFRRIA